MGNQPGQEGYIPPEELKGGKKAKRGGAIKAEPPPASSSPAKPVNYPANNAPPPVQRPGTTAPVGPPIQPQQDLLSTPVSVFPGGAHNAQVLKPQASDSPFLNPITPAKPQQNYFTDLDKKPTNPSVLSPIPNQPGLKLGPGAAATNPAPANPNAASPITKLGAPGPSQAPLNITPVSANQLGVAPKPPIDPTPVKPVVVEAAKPAQSAPAPAKQPEPIKPAQTVAPTPVQAAKPAASQPAKASTPAQTAKPGSGAQPAKPAPAAQPAKVEKTIVKTEPIDTQLVAVPVYSASAVHLNITGMETVVMESIVEVRVPKMQAEYWLLYVPVPPLTSFQYGSKAWVQFHCNGAQPAPFAAAGVDDQGRELIQVTIPVNQHPQFSQGLALSVFFEVNLVARELFFDPSVQLQAQAATQHELMICSSDLGRYLLTDPNFQQYIHTHGELLYRNPVEIGDQTIIYAQRVFHFISENFSVAQTTDTDRNLATIIRNKKSDAAGLSLLLCAILRCQEVPARLLVGRWAKDDAAPYTIAEFYVEQVGWIPADIASMILHGKNKPKNAQGRLPFFGEQPMNFVALHYDLDISVDTIAYGIQSLSSMQTIPFWVSGTGTEDNKQSATKWKLVSRVSHAVH